MPKRSAADAFRELGRWEGETGAEFDALMPAGLVLAMGALTLALGVLTLVTGA